MYRGKQSKKRKQFTVYSSVYVYIYIYIFIFKLLLCFLLFLNHNTFFYFFLFSCKLAALSRSKWRRGDWLSGSRGRSASPPSLPSTWKQGLGERHEWLLKQTIKKHRPCTHLFSISSERRGPVKEGTVWRSGTPDTWHLAPDVTVSSKAAGRFVLTNGGYCRGENDHDGHLVSHCTPQWGPCYVAYTNSGILGCGVASFSPTGFGR